MHNHGTTYEHAYMWSVLVSVARSRGYRSTHLSASMMWWIWSKYAFVEWEFWLSKFVECECE